MYKLQDRLLAVVNSLTAFFNLMDQITSSVFITFMDYPTAHPALMYLYTHYQCFFLTVSISKQDEGFYQVYFSQMFNNLSPVVRYFAVKPFHGWQRRNIFHHDCQNCNNHSSKLTLDTAHDINICIC